MPLRGGAPWIASPSHRSTMFARDAAACSAARSSLRSPSPGLSRRWQQRRRRGQRYVFASASTTIIAPRHRSLHVLGRSGVPGSIEALEDLFVPFDPLPDHLSTLFLWICGEQDEEELAAEEEGSRRNFGQGDADHVGLRCRHTTFALASAATAVFASTDPTARSGTAPFRCAQKHIRRHMLEHYLHFQFCIPIPFSSSFTLPISLPASLPHSLESHLCVSTGTCHLHAVIFVLEQAKTCFWSQDVAISHTLNHNFQHQVPGCSDCTKSLCFEHIKKVFFLH